MDPAALREIYDHHAWSMERLLACTLEVPRELAAEVTGPDALSLRDTLAHIVSAEGNWLARWKADGSHARFRPQSIAGVARGWSTLQAETRALLADLNPADLDRPLARYPRPRDRRNLGASITHVLMHGAQHAAEAAELLTHFDHSPGQLDFMEFLDERERTVAILPSS